MPVLVIAEHDEKTLKPSTWNTIQAGINLVKDNVTVLVAGANPEGAALMAAKIPGVMQVITASAPELAHQLAEPMTQVLESIAPEYDYILAPASTFGKNLLPRLAAKLDVMQISDVIEIVSSDTFRRPMYAGNAIQEVQSLDKIKLLTIRTTAFPSQLLDTQDPKDRIKPLLSLPPLASPVQYIGLEATVSARPELTSARVVVSGGRGLQTKENFTKYIDTLADVLEAAIGASRAAVDAGFVPNDYQVGQTGKVVAPNIYIAIGISGAIQHLAGMKDSKLIIAINKDPDAPIFQVADFGMVGDLFEIVPELTKALVNARPS